MQGRYLLVVVLVSLVAKAETISFAGNLRTDANAIGCGPSCILGPSNADADFAQWAAVVDDFTVTAASSMEALTFSYGGGINGAGQTIAQGGFEPYLSLFDSGGTFLASTFFGTTCPAVANTNTVSGQCFDELLDGGVLDPGSYEIAISAYENLSMAENLGVGTLADGFTGLGNLNTGEDLHYAYDVTLTPVSPVPEPGGACLLCVVVFALVGIRKFTRQKG
jgi:hypothetical protein